MRFLRIFSHSTTGPLTNKELWELHCKKWFPKASMIDPDTPERLDTAAALQSLQQMMQDGPKTLYMDSLAFRTAKRIPH